jgi:hypothetical protein
MFFKGTVLQDFPQFYSISQSFLKKDIKLFRKSGEFSEIVSPTALKNQMLNLFKRITVIGIDMKETRVFESVL